MKTIVEKLAAEFLKIEEGSMMLALHLQFGLGLAACAVVILVACQAWRAPHRDWLSKRNRQGWIQPHAAVRRKILRGLIRRMIKDGVIR